MRLISEPRRQEILRLVWDEELAAGAIAKHFDDVTPSAVSQHCKKLLEAGVLEVRQGGRDGRNRYYSANKDCLGPLAAYLEALWQSRLETLKQLAEERANADE